MPKWRLAATFEPPPLLVFNNGAGVNVEISLTSLEMAALGADLLAVAHREDEDDFLTRCPTCASVVVVDPSVL